MPEHFLSCRTRQLPALGAELWSAPSLTETSLRTFSPRGVAQYLARQKVRRPGPVLAHIGEGGIVRLAPLYDLASALPHDDLDLNKIKLAMPVDENPRDYLSVRLDDPSLPAPISAAMFEATDGREAQLVWNRRRTER